MSRLLSPSVALSVENGFADIGEFCASSPDTSSSVSESLASAELPQLHQQHKLGGVDLNEVADELEEELVLCLSTGYCNLSQMGLVTTPANIPYESLVTLLLSGNQIKEISESLFTNGNFQFLCKLDLSSNCLESVPKSLFKLMKLEVLLLDHNNITRLPVSVDEQIGSQLLPALQRIGLEFNDLSRFPIELFKHCPSLEAVYLSQNLRMLNEPVSVKQLLQAAAVESSKENHRVLLKVDNKPVFVQQMYDEKWDEVLPWLDVELHKIYPDKVLSFLYLGSLRTAQTPLVYRDLDIGFILSAGRNMTVHVESGMRHLVLPIDDHPGEKLRPIFDMAFNFIDDAREEGKGVLLHCFAGLSRSVTIAVAYLMSRYNYKRDEAIEMIRRVRPSSQPNSGFMDILAQYEQELNNQKHHM